MTMALHLERGDRRRPHLTREPSVPPVGAAEAPDGSPGPPLWRRALSGLFTMLIVATAIYLWPAPLGGSTRLVVVSGHSMEPTYMYGDIVVARDRPRTEIGDAVVFQIPDGGADGMLVIHRVLLVDDEGYFITQGDNRDTPDQWQLTEDDIVGQPLLHIPFGGHVVWFLQQRMVIGMLVGLLIVFVLWPKDDDRDADNDADADADDADGATLGPGEVTLSPDAVWLLGGWSRTEIDDATMRDAVAWLDEQIVDRSDVDDSHDAEEPEATESGFAALAARLRATR